MSEQRETTAPRERREKKMSWGSEGLCVNWTYDCTERLDGKFPTLRSGEFTFQGERYVIEFILHEDELPGLSKLTLLSAEGGRRRPTRPFDVTVLVWRERSSNNSGPMTCTRLAKETVSEVPWLPDYDKGLLNKHVTIGYGYDHFAWFQVSFTLLFQERYPFNSIIKENLDSPTQTEGTSNNSDLENLSLDFANLLKNKTLPDVKLKCGGRDHAIPVHRSVLAARSEVFAAMFRNKMAESQSGDVVVADVEDDVIDPFLQYVYCGKIPSGLPDEVLPRLYAAADKYAVHALRKTCRDRMVRGLTEENCVNFLAVADAHGDADFKKSVIEFICSHEAVLKGDAWREFTKNLSTLVVEVYDSFVESKASDNHPGTESE